MKVAILVTPELVPIPDNIKVEMDFQDVSVFVEAKQEFVTGNHMVLEGDKLDFISWLGKYEGVWISEGIPQLQKFKIHHVTSKHLNSNEIDELTERWHNCKDDSTPLHQYLGLTQKEYKTWVETGEFGE